MFRFFKRKPKVVEDGRKEKIESIVKKSTAAEDVIRKVDEMRIDRRCHDKPFLGDDRRQLA